MILELHHTGLGPGLEAPQAWHNLQRRSLQQLTFDKHGVREIGLSCFLRTSTGFALGKGDTSPNFQILFERSVNDLANGECQQLHIFL